MLWTIVVILVVATPLDMLLKVSRREDSDSYRIHS
jgi:hypothetical protein